MRNLRHQFEQSVASLTSELHGLRDQAEARNNELNLEIQRMSSEKSDLEAAVVAEKQLHETHRRSIEHIDSLNQSSSLENERLLKGKIFIL
jgi:hypothetical protein